MFVEDVLDCDGKWTHEEAYIDRLHFLSYSDVGNYIKYMRTTEGDNAFIF